MSLGTRLVLIIAIVSTAFICPLKEEHGGRTLGRTQCVCFQDSTILQNLRSKHEAFALSTPPTVSREQLENFYQKNAKKKNHSNYPMYIKIWVWQSKICIMSIAHIIFKVGVASLTVHSTGKD